VTNCQQGVISSYALGRMNTIRFPFDGLLHGRDCVCEDGSLRGHGDNLDVKVAACNFCNRLPEKSPHRYGAGDPSIQDSMFAVTLTNTTEYGVNR
jgi:hypothetical protein